MIRYFIIAFVMLLPSAHATNSGPDNIYDHCFDAIEKMRDYPEMLEITKSSCEAAIKQIEENRILQESLKQVPAPQSTPDVIYIPAPPTPNETGNIRCYTFDEFTNCTTD